MNETILLRQTSRVSVRERCALLQPFLLGQDRRVFVLILVAHF